MVDIAEIRAQVGAWADLMKEKGIAKIKTDTGFEIEMTPSAFFERGYLKEADVKAFNDALHGPASEEDALFWSAGGSGLKDTNGELHEVPLVGETDGD